MGLKEIVGIRQYTGFTKAGKAEKRYRVTFTTEKAEDEFHFDMAVEGYTAETAIALARARAEEIDKAIG